MNRSEFRQDSNRPILIALIGLLVVSVATLVLAAIGLFQLIQASTDLDASYHRHQQLEAVFDSLQDAETGQRGYIITNDQAYLAPYQQGVVRLPGQLAELEKTTRNTAYFSQVEQLKNATGAKLAEMKRVIDLSQTQGFAAAQAAIDSGEGKHLMDQARQLVASIESRQLAYQDQQRSHAASFGLFTNVVIAVAIMIVIMLAGLVYWLYRKAIMARRELDRAKDEFVSLASHQLRTPATGIKSILSMLGSQDFGALNDRQRYFLGKAVESNERELNIIEELLSIAKADAGRLILHLTECDMSAIIEGIVTEQRRTIESKRIKLIIEQPSKPLSLVADAEKLYMALGNLLDNARKYTPEDGRITVTLVRRHGTVVVEVTDTGIGIDEADLAQVFDRFRRASNAIASPVDGTGLGLYLARRIAELHNGTIEVSSKKGHGSRFTLILPLRKA